MANNMFTDMLRSLFGFGAQPPRNEFRNPIWGDDDDDGDELYDRHASVGVYTDPEQLHSEISRQVHDMFKSFGSMFGDIKMFTPGEDNMFDAAPIAPPDGEDYDNNTLRNYYLKPGYHANSDHMRQDMDLDGKISSQDITGLLKSKDESTSTKPFDGHLVPGRSYCRTIITTSIKKPDGTVETRKIIKNGNEVIEETTTTSPTMGTDPKVTNFSGLEQIPDPQTIYNNILSEFSSRWNNFF